MYKMAVLGFVRSRRHVVVVFVVSVVQFLVILPALSGVLPFAWYSFYSNVLPQDSHAWQKVINMNRARVEKAQLYFQESNETLAKKYYFQVKESDNVYLSVALVTVNRSRGLADPRERLGYLFQSSFAVDKFAKSKEFINRTFVFVCNVDNNPNDHKDAEFIQKYMPYTARYGSSDFHSNDPLLPKSDVKYRYKQHTSTYEKETYDYMYCLRMAQTTNPRYILVVEDDAIAHRHLPTVLKYTLEKRLASTEHFAYLKLYYPIKWQGYSFELLSLMELLSVGLVGGGLIVVFLSAVTYSRSQSSKVENFYFFVGLIFFIVTAEFLGRQNVIEIRRLSPQLYQFRPSPGCCTPAMLYPTGVVDSLVNHLTSFPPDTHTDLAIYDFTKVSNTPSYMLEPNLFYHVGMYTSLKEGYKQPEQFMFNVWW